MGDAAAHVGDDYHDLDVPHAAAEANALEVGGRLEPKWYRNKNGTRRLYYVIRFEKRHANGQRYRPMRYVGINPAGSIAVDVPHASAHVPHAVPHAARRGPHADQESRASDEA